MNSQLLNSSTPKLLNSVSKPRKIVVPISTAIAWGNDGDQFVYQEKLDGRFETRRVHAGSRVAHRENSLGETILAGEYMRGEFYAFDLLQLRGENCRPWPLRERLIWLDEVFNYEPKDCTGGIIHRVPTLNYQPSTLNEIWSRGGEGIVRKRLDSPCGTPMEACKRLETFYCVVTGMNSGQSVAIARIQNPEASSQNVVDSNSFESTPCGSVSLFGGKCNQVRAGSVIKVEGFGLTRDGKIREPRRCKDSPTSWLVKY